ncbi:MAG: response regulator [Candidatus Dormibacteraeota bacterium]|nr:response regulator [Candidatus Dormibacteraeota bacterium]
MSASGVLQEQLDTDALLKVLMAFKEGDFTARLPASWTGVPGKVADALNEVIARNQRMSEELARVGRVVGKEGRLDQRLPSNGSGGGWAESVRSVNDLIEDLVQPHNQVTRVVEAVARGDLSQTVPLEVGGRPLEGQFAQTARTANTMLAQLSSFSSEVTRVAREVGTQGKLGGQARVEGVAGVWRDLTDNVNSMATNLTDQVRNIAEVTTAVANGDLSKKVTVDVQGEILELKDTINVMVDHLNAFAREVTRVAHEVGTEGKLGGQAEVEGVAGVWKDLTENVNQLADQLTEQVRGIARVVTAVANGDLSKKVTVDVQGEILELKDTINVMVDQLNAFAGEVTRVAREVGTEGKLGGQAEVEGVAGVWKELTDNVNLMAANLTEQVRGIATVVTAVANGDLTRKMTVESKGEIAALAQVMNEVTATLATFADQITSVAREVGIEGRLGGQARVPGAAGTWRALTDNVNQLAATLTDQIRAIAEVATAVTEGDLTRSIGVEAWGEVAVLKHRVNEMIRTLRETTRRNNEQDWLKTNLTRFSRMLQGQRDLQAVSWMVLSEVAPLVSARHGAFYTVDANAAEGPRLRFQAGYAHHPRAGLPSSFRMGEGLVGQCALERRRIIIDDLPSDYISISSGLGEAPPVSLIVLPVLFEGQLKAVIELASFQRFADVHLDFLDQLTESIGIVLNTIEANMRTEALLKQSQSLAGELQAQQEELRRTNGELRQNAQLLAEQNLEVERKNLEVEQARSSLEEKAEQLALASKYKTEFLANMSHELRTPLNSLLILAQRLADNPEQNLTSNQIEFANVIKASGQDLLALINDILDVSRIEAGRMAVEVGDVAFTALAETVERSFRHLAEAKGLAFGVQLEAGLPPRLRTDANRLLQILRNLLANAIKFTEQGRVEVRARRASSGWDPGTTSLNEAESVIAIDVTDTGIGIPGDKQAAIFEAFEQADGTTSRKYGGSGLGLSISRGLARLLGGEIGLESTVGKGSTFTLYLPVREDLPAAEAGTNPAASWESSSTPVVEAPRPDEVADEPHPVSSGESTILIVEDDPKLAQALLGLARAARFTGIVALRSSEAVPLARRHRPKAVILDTRLRGGSGWQVLEQLQQNPATRATPVHLLAVVSEKNNGHPDSSVADGDGQAATSDSLTELRGQVQRHLDHGVRSLLLAEDDPQRREVIMEALAGPGIEIHAAGSVQEALDTLNSGQIGCILLDLELGGAGGFEVLRSIQQSSRLQRIPVVVYTAAPAAGTPQARARARTMDTGGHSTRVLVVDDDIRNVYALTAVLESHEVQVVTAETGDEALACLREDPSIDAVLLDMMMPDKDGYETMKEIRALPGRQELCVIAVTARAMEEDRDRCLKAGATDYVAKPVEPAALLTMLRRSTEGKP